MLYNLFNLSYVSESANPMRPTPAILGFFPTVVNHWCLLFTSICRICCYVQESKTESPPSTVMSETLPVPLNIPQIRSHILGGI